MGLKTGWSVFGEPEQSVTAHLLLADLDDSDLEQMLFPRSVGDVRGSLPQPDWSYLHRELRRKGVTLSLLWEEYRAVHPNGYGYSRFCELYTRWDGKLSPVMRQRHPAGERLFVDYAGTTMDVICPQTGEVRTAQLFVATLGASNYTYVEASWTQSLPDWISSHVRAFAFFGGVPAQVVSDNLKAGVTKACFYDPAINRTYGDKGAAQFRDRANISIHYVSKNPDHVLTVSYQDLHEIVQNDKSLFDETDWKRAFKGSPTD